MTQFEERIHNATTRLEAATAQLEERNRTEAARREERNRTAATQREAAATQRKEQNRTAAAQWQASRRAFATVPVPRGVRIAFRFLLAGVVLTIVSFVVIPVALLAIPFLVVALVMFLVNFKRSLVWSREYKAERAQILVDLQRLPLS